MTTPPRQADWLRLDLVLPASAPRPITRGRPARVALTWHDTDDRALARRGQALVEVRRRRDTVWQLLALRTDGSTLPYALGMQDAIIIESARFEDLAVTEVVGPVAQLEAAIRTVGVPCADVTAQVLEGYFRFGATTQPVRRLLLSGPAGAVEQAAIMLGAAVPPQTLSGAALALVWPTFRPVGAPILHAGMTLDAAFVHIVEHLAAIIVDLVPAVCAGETAEPVHQMRVAIRRLRSAMSLFGNLVACPPVSEAKTAMRDLAQALAPARAWDVFLDETWAAIAEALPSDPAVVALQAAASDRRQVAYADLRAILVAPTFAALTVRLACLAAVRPWAAMTDELSDFAARALKRRAKRLRATGRHIGTLEIAALHALRLKTKRLRYAAEFFTPLYPGHAARRSLRALADLQDELGHLNDAATAEALLAELPTDLATGYAGGLVRGFVAGSHANGRTQIEAAWRRLRKQKAPW